MIFLIQAEQLYFGKSFCFVTLNCCFLNKSHFVDDLIDVLDSGQMPRKCGGSNFDMYLY